MANLADDGNTGMLKKILSAYFSENTEENNALKRRFLLSHRINGTPKDPFFVSPGTEAGKI